MYKSIQLDYGMNDLEGFLDEKTLDIHFNSLYKGYLNRLNKVLTDNNYDFRYTKEELLEHIDEFPIRDRDAILYNLGGVLNHERYFLGLSPSPSLKENALMMKLKEKYGSIDNFKKEFMEKALIVIGSGYTNLVMDRNGGLNIINTSNQELPDFYGFYPLISLDLWEHAYFLKYYQNKQDYINNFFNYINYEAINTVYEEKTKKL